MSKRLSRIRKNRCEKIVTNNGVRTTDYEKPVITSHLDVKELVYYDSELSKHPQSRLTKDQLKRIFSKAVNE